MLVYLSGCSEGIGELKKTVQIQMSKFGRPKYHRGHPVKGQQVSGSVEHQSGKTFLVPVLDRTAGTLMVVTDAWIEPGTTVIGDCWAAYQDLDAQGYTHRSGSHNIFFNDWPTVAHTNTVESTWRM
jgi:hypothetical protein